MILYNASTSVGLRNFTRRITKTNSTTYTNNDVDASINNYLHLFVNEAIQSMDGWDFEGEIATTSLVASQQEYVFPSDILKIKRIEITYDGTNWYKVRFADVNTLDTTADSTTVNQNFQTTNPFADIHDSSIFLYPIPTATSTNGLKIWYENEVTELSADADEPTIPEAYQKGLCYGAATDYFDREAESKKSRYMEQKMEKNIFRMKDFVNRRNQDREYTIEQNFVDFEYGDN